MSGTFGAGWLLQNGIGTSVDSDGSGTIDDADAHNEGVDEHVAIDNFSVTLIPEPTGGTLALLGIGLLALRRRR